MKKHNRIPVEKLTTSHSLQLEDGSLHKIKSIVNGFYPRSKLITYVNGQWSCLLNTDKVNAFN